MTKKANSTIKSFNVITTDLSKANNVQIKYALEKAFMDYDKLSQKNFQVILNMLDEMKVPIDRTINNMRQEN